MIFVEKEINVKKMEFLLNNTKGNKAKLFGKGRVYRKDESNL
ncbi:Putative peptidyl-prolyl cis-trans isomerase D [Gossypium arboreum]|uniref:Putative peptidyl-prolyl cis-trans isomerase D n=1 Tax=Gossypium arboreum TaxID=29729 RepID=A0A0B0MJK6_GOSAR|nr:Putative peptidyl-prolyl cis-trans isomerase D [Gossypium arboreum]